MPNNERCLNTGQTPFCLLSNLAREPIRRSGCPWDETLKKGPDRRNGGQAFWHCFVQRFDNIRTRPLLIRTQGIRFCFNKDRSISTRPCLCSIPYYGTTRWHLWRGKPRNITVITRVAIQCMFLPTTSDLMLWRLLLCLLSSVLTLNISRYNTLAVSLLLRVRWI